MSSSPSNSSGFAFVGDKGTGKTKLLQLAAVVPSVLLDNVVSVSMDAKSDVVQHHGLTPSMLLWAALHRRVASPSPLPRRPSYDLPDIDSSIDPLLDFARASRLAVVVCVDEARATYHPDSTSAASWPELHSTLQRFTACAFIADSTTTLPALVRGTDSALITAGLGYPKVRDSLNGDKIAVVSIDRLQTRKQYEEFLTGLGPLGKAYASQDLEDLHLRTSGLYPSIMRYVSGAKAHCDENLNLPDVGSLGFSLLGRMVAALRLSQNAALTDTFEMQWFSESVMMNWVQSYNKSYSRQEGQAALVRLVEDQVLRQALNKSPHSSVPHYTFGSAAQFRYLLRVLP